ncbi:MAG: ATP-binding cassette domain-containing protein [Myxococcota bacterium]
MDPNDIVLNCQGVHRHFNTPKGVIRVLGDINMRVIRGEIIGLVGASGCGKSTLLNMILGTLQPTVGSILVSTAGGIREVKGHGRDRGMVFQHYSLYPHLTAIQNVALGLMLNETSIPGRWLGWVTGSWRRLRKEHLEKSEQLLVQLRLGDALHQYPHQLSGGMKQRVAVARALIMEPEVLLLDEPFGAQDRKTKRDAHQLLYGLREENKKSIAAGLKPPNTIIMVTHSLEEAIQIGDRVIGLSRGWDYTSAGFEEHPGATIVYSDRAPNYDLSDTQQAGQLHELANHIDAVVFEGQNLPRDKHRTFWTQIEEEGAA